MKNTPQWAKDIAIELECDVNIEWVKVENEKDSFGWTGNLGDKISGYLDKTQRGRILSKDTIRIYAGKNIAQHKIVLLHELAHRLLNENRHNKKFWNKAIELFEKYNIPEEDYIEREFGEKRWHNYRAIARRVYADRKPKL